MENLPSDGDLMGPFIRTIPEILPVLRVPKTKRSARAERSRHQSAIGVAIDA